MMGSDMERATCAYCGTDRPLSEMKKAVIIYQDSKPGLDRRGKYKSIKFVAKKKQLYCADKPCADYDQMAHEG
jgi:hypothetical protein